MRTNLDLLNAEQQVLSAQRDLAGARYAYLLAGLSLKAAAGALSVADLEAIDKMLSRPSSSPSAATTTRFAPVSAPVATPVTQAAPAPKALALKKDTLRSLGKPTQTAAAR